MFSVKETLFCFKVLAEAENADECLWISDIHKLYFFKLFFKAILNKLSFKKANKLKKEDNKDWSIEKVVMLFNQEEEKKKARKNRNQWMELWLKLKRKEGKRNQWAHSWGGDWNFEAQLRSWTWTQRRVKWEEGKMKRHQWGGDLRLN